MLRFEGVFMIHELRRKGLAIAEIARLIRRDRKTMRKYLQRGMEQPKYGPRGLRPRFDPYHDYIRARLKAARSSPERGCCERSGSEDIREGDPR